MKKLLVLLCVIASAASSAATLVNTGLPGSFTSALTLGPVPAPTNVQNIGIKFSLATAATIEGFSGLLYGSGGALTFSLFAADGLGGLPGTQIFSTSFAPASTTFPSPAWVGPGGMSLLVTAGSYWATFEDRAGQSFLGGMPESVPTSSVYALSNSPGVWFGGTSTHKLGLQVYGVTAVPEPLVLSMMLAGLSAIGFVSRRHARI